MREREGSSEQDTTVRNRVKWSETVDNVLRPKNWGDSREWVTTDDSYYVVLCPTRACRNQLETRILPPCLCPILPASHLSASQPV